MPLTQAAGSIVPVAITAAESVDQLRTWAAGRCLSADQAGIDCGPSTGDARKPRRKIPRDPSVN